MSTFLVTSDKADCCACSACVQICPQKCISMKMDQEGFAYPDIDKQRCISCKLCERVCPMQNGEKWYIKPKNTVCAYGGYNKDADIRKDSTSGGAFSAIIESYCKGEYAIFGAAYCNDSPVLAEHRYVTNKKSINAFRGSKYVQSNIGNSYCDVKAFLEEGKKVLFSGTPCQIAGLYSFLKRDYDNLLTVDLVCGGVPTPKFIKREKQYYEEKYKSEVTSMSYRYKNINHWDNTFMQWTFKNGKSKTVVLDWFYSLFTSGLMSRPSCYKCQYTSLNRCGDFTIADFWGVSDIDYDLYSSNRGTSLMLLNSEKGKREFDEIKKLLVYKKVDVYEAQKYNLCMRQAVKESDRRDSFFEDIDSMDFLQLCAKYIKRPGALQRYFIIHTPRWLKLLVKKVTFNFLH